MPIEIRMASNRKKGFSDRILELCGSRRRMVAPRMSFGDNQVFMSDTVTELRCEWEGFWAALFNKHQAQ